MKRLAILGSTGSIGQNALDVVKHFPEEFEVLALSTNSNINLLSRQIKVYRPSLVCVNQPQAALRLEGRLNLKAKILEGEEGLEQIVQDKRIDMVLLAISGSSALAPLLKAIEAGKDIALANKESLVMAGSIIMEKAAKKKIKLIPIDSEESAIWQCLEGEDRQRLKNIYLTASGGPFREAVKSEIKNVSVRQVISHPRWKMGKKVSVDSASMMNKGLEVLETMYLFGVPARKIKVLIHTEAIVHSMVEFIDGVVMAQLSVTDMRIPIQYALTYPKRKAYGFKRIDFCKLGSLHFAEPDFQKFPCLELAYQVAANPGTNSCVLNAANEISVNEFLQERLDFIEIPKVIERVLHRHRNIRHPTLDEIKETDAWARREAYAVIEKLQS